MPREQRDYQRAAADFLHDHPRCNLHAGMGLGKTSIVLHMLARLIAEGWNEPVLVIGPKRVANDVWPREPADWPELSHLVVERITGPGWTRSRALDRPAHLHTINYDNVPWLVNSFERDWPFALVIADESPRLKGFRLRQGTQRAAALARVAHTPRVKRWINLTGTPAPNGLLDLWGQQWFIDGGKALGRSFRAFEQRWFCKAPGGGQYAPTIPMPNAMREIHDAMRPTTLAIDAAQYFPTEAPIENTVYVEITGRPRALYRQMEREFIAQLREGTIEAPTAAVKTLKLLQLASGAVYHSDSSYETVHEGKCDALASIREECSGAPLLVVYQFVHELARIRDRFPGALVLADDPSAVDRWNAGDVRMLLLHPASAGHGLSLQHGGNNVVFFSTGWNLEHDQQVIERIGPARQKQSGYDRPVYVHRIVARGTIDEMVLRRQASKASVQELLLEMLRA